MDDHPGVRHVERLGHPPGEEVQEEHRMVVVLGDVLMAHQVVEGLEDVLMEHQVVEVLEDVLMGLLVVGVLGDVLMGLLVGHYVLVLDMVLLKDVGEDFHWLEVLLDNYQCQRNEVGADAVLPVPAEGLLGQPPTKWLPSSELK